MTAPMGYEAVKALAAELRRPVSTLYVLSPRADPFFSGSPQQVVYAQWFAAIWRKHAVVGGHIRRLHYRMVSQETPLLMPGGGPYINTDECWTQLGDAGQWARYQNLVDPALLGDKRSPPPHLHLDPPLGERDPPTTRVNGAGWSYAGMSISWPSLGDPPYLALNWPALPWRIPQSHQVEVWVEKSDVEDIALPLAYRYRLNYCGFTGQVGIKPCLDLIKRAVQSGRPVRILYISDFDPQGKSMPVAVARKIEFLAAQLGLDLDIEVRPIALTQQQCIDLKLPRMPIKESDRGKARFEEQYGEGATELDALEALHPGLLRRLIETEVKRYHDPTLDDRAKEADDEASQWVSDEIEALNKTVLANHQGQFDEIREGLEALRLEAQPIAKQLVPIRKKAEALIEQATAIHAQIEEELRDEAPAFEPVELPEPAAADEDPDPLFKSTRSYLDQIAIYKAHQGKPTERRKRGKANGLDGGDP